MSGSEGGSGGGSGGDNATGTDPERIRLEEDQSRLRNWSRWGPYLAERQWGTVREDYSADGTCWESFPHDHARSRAYRWGEDGILGFADRECRLCAAVALWNGKDPILKERLFGLTNAEGNHGEDVKEVYHYRDATPTASYCAASYHYPLAAFPYAELIEENRRRGRAGSEYELTDTAAYQGGCAEVVVEYAKAEPDDILWSITITNRAAAAAELHVLPTVWFRNTWSWGGEHESGSGKPVIERANDQALRARHETLGEVWIAAEAADADPVSWLFTDNDTNTQRLYGVSGAEGAAAWTKDAFHRRVVGGEATAVNAAQRGTKAAAWHRLRLEPGESRTIRLRWRAGAPPATWFGEGFDRMIAARRAEADAFYALVTRGSPEERSVARQAFAGLVWCKQFYHLVMTQWAKGDPAMPAPPPGHAQSRNADWPHLYARDVLSMPDSWEYPWFAAWDLAFHCIPLARIDIAFAKKQLELLLREWYMHPNGQIPAYEFAFGDVNPPVHAWACWRVYRIGQRQGLSDLGFLERCFQKLLMNFTWWVNRKDPNGRHLFAGGFLGLDNIGVFDRSKPLPGGAQLAQADGTAWMAVYAARMLTIALELARHNPSYEDIASKFFEHYVHIADAINHLNGHGLWDEEDGFYYDHLLWGDGRIESLRVRSMVGIIPLFAAVVLKREHLERFPGFAKRLKWFEAHPTGFGGCLSWLAEKGADGSRRLLSIPSRKHLERVLARVFDPQEFLSPYGVRSLSRAHLDQPFVMTDNGATNQVDYEPGTSTSGLFGGNSNWRGPVWFPVNHLLIEALREYHEFYGAGFTISHPSGNGRMTLADAAADLGGRLASLFLRGKDGKRPCLGAGDNGGEWVQFHEYFHGETGQGLGASHQTGWTALATEYLGGMA